MKVEDDCMNPTTHANLYLCFDGSKACQIHYGYVKDKPQDLIDVLWEGDAV